MIEIYFTDLKEEKQKEILEALGDNGNYDVFPIAEIAEESDEVSEPGLDLEAFIRSDYNENTDDELNYYIKADCKVGDIAYLYRHEEGKLEKLEIVHLIKRSDNISLYDELIKDEDILIAGEIKYGADTAAEFIFDNDCYLVWFDYVFEKENV